MDVAAHVAREQRIRNALNRRARRELRIGADGDAEITNRAVEDLVAEGHHRSERDRVIALIEGDRVLLAPDRRLRRGRVVDGEEDRQRSIDGIVARIEEAPLVRDRLRDARRGVRRQRHHRGACSEPRCCQHPSNRAGPHDSPRAAREGRSVGARVGDRQASDCPW
ncbi:Flagellar biosynthesis protein FlhA [Minicystis rosea]|nr:Flagellar biosynthesis protein FlhA [Minicystis rosea]